MGLKDMMKSFLYENVEEDDFDTDEEPAAASQPASAAASAPAATPVQSAPVQPAQPVMPAEAVMQPLDQGAVMEQTDAFLQEESTAQADGSFLSRLDDSMNAQETQPEPAKKSRTLPSRTAARKGRQGIREEYSAVLSPIFGNLPDDKKDHAAIHDAINLPRPTEALDMVEIISPMYGVDPQASKKNGITKRVKKAAPSKDHQEGQPAPQQAEPSAALETAALDGQADQESKPANLADYLTQGMTAQPAPHNAAPHKSRTSYGSKKGGKR